MGNITITRRTRAIRFHRTSLHIVRRAGEVWLRAPQIGGALGYRDAASRISKLYQQHAAEFTDRMTQLIKLPTAGGEQEVRVFSLRGAHLLAMFARTERAAEFRRWVLDVLDGQAAPAAVPARPVVVAPRPAPAAPPMLAAPSREPERDGQPRFEIPPQIVALLDRHAFALATQAYDELRAWLHERAHQRCVNGLGQWFGVSYVQGQLDRVGLAEWQVAYHAKRVRALRLLAEGAKAMTAEWADKLAAHCDALEPGLPAWRETALDSGPGAVAKAARDFRAELPPPDGDPEGPRVANADEDIAP